MTTGTFMARVNEYIAQCEEYEITHQDAGNAYGHLASEGDFDYHNGENRLQEYCDEMGIDITGVDLDRLAEEVIFRGHMIPGSDWDSQKRFLVASYNVGEIECQIDSSDIGARFTHWMIDKLNRETDAYWAYVNTTTARFYINLTDNYWDHVCNEDVIRDLVNQQKES